MSEDDTPLSPEELERLREEMREDMLEIERQIKAELDYLDRLLALLAWTYRQAKAPRPLTDPRNWPGVWPMDWQETRELVFTDPLLFDLARHQAAADLKQGSASSEDAALLLLSERPKPGQGSTEGRTAIASLTLALREAVFDWNLWGVSEKETERGNPWSSWPTDHGLSEVLADRLTSHPILADCPDAVPSSEDIRNVLRSCVKRR